MTPSYDFKMPETFVPRPMPPPMAPPPAPPPFNPNIGGRVRMPEPEDGEDLTDLMQYYQPQSPMYVPPMPVNPAPSMFGGVTMPPAMSYTPPMAPALRAPNGYNPLYGSIIPNFNTVYPNPPVTVADPFPPPPSRPALIEPMPMPRPTPPPPPRNYDIGGRIRSEEPEPEGNAFFTL